MESIWKLEGVFADFEEMSCETYEYFLTASSDVKASLQDYISGCDNSLHHVIATELPLNSVADEFTFLRRRVYLPDGSLYVAMDYRNLASDYNFQGRDHDELKVKIGDKCYCFFSNEIKTGVVVDLPPSENSRLIGMDNFDDSYTVFIGVDKMPENITKELYMQLHEHICVDSIFKME